jgi:protein SCO1
MFERFQICFPVARPGFHFVAAFVSIFLFLPALIGPEANADTRAPHRRFPEIELTTHEGKRVRFYEDLIQDKVVSINFIFTRCSDSCPAETAKLKEVYDRLGDRVGRDIFMYSISIDPEHDTPGALKEFAEKFQTGPGWLFLRADEDDVRRLEERFGLDLNEDEYDDPKDHNISLVMGNERTGQWIKRSPFDNPGALARILSYRLFDGMVARNDVKSYSEVPELPQLSEGAFLFRTRCESCHTLGGGEGLGPDLIGVTARRERSWLARWIREPDKMIEEGDPQALALYAQYRELAMPNLRLEHTEVNALLEFLVEQDRERGIVPIPGRQARID